MPENASVLPPIEEVSRLLSGILGRTVTAVPALVQDAAARSRMFWWIYRNRAGEPRFACGCDVALVAYLGAALLSFPLNRAEETIRKNQMDPVFEENTREVFNIFAQCLNAPGREHLRLVDAVQPATPAIRSVLQWIQTPTQRDLDVQVSGYGRGRITMLRIAEAAASRAASG